MPEARQAHQSCGCCEVWHWIAALAREECHSWAVAANGPGIACRQTRSPVDVSAIVCKAVTSHLLLLARRHHPGARH